MALRHPNAFTLFAVAPVDESPISDYARSIMQLHARQGVTQDQFLESWSAVQGFLIGFLLMETARVTAEAGHSASPKRTHDEFDDGMAAAISDDAFDKALEVVLNGFQARL